jgi:predicted Zn-dependent protease
MGIFVSQSLTHLAFLLLTCATISPALKSAQAQPPAFDNARFEDMIRQFASPLDSFIPGVLTEITPQQLARLDVVPVSQAEEAAFGKRILNDYERQLKLTNKGIVRTGPDVEYLNKLSAAIRVHMTHGTRYKNLRIGVVDLDVADAYSIPGGDLLFTTELLKTAGSEAALVGVVAHELSHLDRGHQLYALKQSKLVQKTPNFRNMMQAVAAVAKPFHPEFESQADQDAFTWMVAAGYDPRELARLLDRWSQRQDQRFPWAESMPTFLRSHPAAGIRAQSLLKQFEQLPPGHPALVIGIKNLEQRLPHFEKSLDN